MAGALRKTMIYLGLAEGDENFEADKQDIVAREDVRVVEPVREDPVAAKPAPVAPVAARPVMASPSS